MEKLFRSRAARVGIAGLLIAGGLWGFAPYVLKDVASAAYVNAELTQVATPVAGVLTQGLPREGAYLSRDARLRLVTARTPSRARLDDLLQQAALADSTVALMETQLAELRSNDATLAARSNLFQRASVGRLAGRVREAEANVARCEAQQRDLQERLSRAANLAEKGFISDAGLRSAREAAEAGDQACKASRGAVEAIQAEDTAAQRGVYLSDGSNDAPYAEQQRARLMLRRQELMTELVRAKASPAPLRGQVAAERDLYARASS